MAKSEIYMRFRNISLILIAACVLLSKALYIVYILTASDVSFTGAQNVLLKAVPQIARYTCAVLGVWSQSAAVCAVVWGVSFFGKRTAAKMSLYTFALLLSGLLIMFVYNLIRNSLSAHQLIAAALSMCAEAAFMLLLIAAGVGIGRLYAGRRFNSASPRRISRFSPMKAQLASLSFGFLVRIADLTAFNVVPYLSAVSSPSSADITGIVLDYVYYAMLYAAAAFLLAYATDKILLSKVGRLKPKVYGKAAGLAVDGVIHE